MAYTSAPFGARTWGELLRVRAYGIATANTTAVFHGDVVKHGGTSYATKPLGRLPGIADTAANAGAAGVIVGYVVGLMLYNGDPTLYIPAATTGDSVIAGIALVADHPDQLFIMQEDSVSENIVAGDIGLNFDLVVGSGGSTGKGLSSHMIDSSTEATTSTLAVKLHNMRPDMTIATADTTAHYGIFICQFNAHHYGSNIDGIS